MWTILGVALALLGAWLVHLWFQLRGCKPVSDPPRQTLRFERRVYCKLHIDVALAHVIGVDGIVCVVCRAQRAAQLERLLSAGDDFDYARGRDDALHYTAALAREAK